MLCCVYCLDVITGNKQQLCDRGGLQQLKILFFSSAICVPHCFMEWFWLFGPLIYEAAVC